MAEVTAKLVAQLREATGLGMMDCKRALVETAGDFAAAEQLLRIKSGNKASKLAGRTAAEGAIVAFVDADATQGALLEVNCETDFVAKDEQFRQFCQQVAEAIVRVKPVDVEALAMVPLAHGKTVEDSRKALISKIGENISLRRFTRYQATAKLAVYLHNNKIGVIVDYQSKDAQLGRDIAMHIAASKPIWIDKAQVPTEVLERERSIFAAQAAASGKPENIVQRIIEGNVDKYLAEVALLEQRFVKDTTLTIEQLLAQRQATVHAFQMYVVGEGIEKKTVDFAAEVAAATKN